jgi:beta-galactosidase
MLKIMDLNKNWTFTKEDSQVYAQQESIEAELVNLPHCWNAEDGQNGEPGFFRGKCWYQRKLVIRQEELEKFIFLEIGAAGLVSEVYINGHLAGGSQCGFAMYRVLLNSFLYTGENLISIMVDNCYHEDVYPLMADFTFYGGLYREVKLIVAESFHFDLLDNGKDGIYLTQHVIEENTFELQINGSIINELSEIKAGKLKFNLFDKNKKMVFAKELDIVVSKKSEFNFIEKIAGLNLWQGIENPYLYTMKVELIYDDQVCDERNIEIGFRSIEVTPDKGVFLNGKSIKINGVSRHQDFAGVGNALTKEHMDLDFALLKEIGANSVRLSHYQHDDYFYSLCDRAGLLVWAEIPFISVPTITDEKNLNAKEQLEKLIKQAYNHSSIYCWGVQNEITIAVENEKIYKMVEDLNSWAKKLDTSRLTAQANIYSVAEESPLTQITDILGYNLYYGWYYGKLHNLGERLDKVHQGRPNIPVILSEYGVDTNPKFHSYNPAVKDYTEEYQLLFFDNALKTINERTFVLGAYQWILCDFGSESRDEGGEKSKNLKGLVTIDRKVKKDAFYLFKAYWSKIPFVHLAGRRFLNRHEALNNITVLSNLSHIKLFVNQEFIAGIQNEEALKVFKEVKLELGKNSLKVEGYDTEGNVYQDEMILNHVSEMDKNYIHEVEPKKHVTNWFEKFDLTTVQEVTLKEGYYSTFDTVTDLYENNEARAVFKKYFGEMAEQPRFQAMIGVTTINNMAKISRNNIPKELLTVINQELNNIPKGK